MPNKNNFLNQAKINKKDEFYTKYSDIEKELRYYTHHLEDKIIYCNCDDHKKSNFYKYFSNNFKKLKLNALITSYYKKKDIFDSNREKIFGSVTDSNGFNEFLIENGDFRSKESINLLKSADLIITNPPFSLFSSFVEQLLEYNKKFLILGAINVVTYKKISPAIIENKLWLGKSVRNGDIEFEIPENYVAHRVDKNNKRWVRVPGIRWFTNLTYEGQHFPLKLTKKYDPELYPKYVNCDAINVDKIKDIPMDYDGLMGVPITYLDKHDNSQFKMIRFSVGDDGKLLKLKDKTPYKRLLIKRK